MSHKDDRNLAEVIDKMVSHSKDYGLTKDLNELREEVQDTPTEDTTELKMLWLAVHSAMTKVIFPDPSNIEIYKPEDKWKLEVLQDYTDTDMDTLQLLYGWYA